MNTSSRRSFLKTSVAGAVFSSAGILASTASAQTRKWDETFDVIVVGSGFAGLAAAIEAKKAGANVIVLETLMKKRWIAIAMLAVLLMGNGGAIGKVGVRQESDGSAYSLYFVERDLRSADGGDALRSEERTLEDGGLSTEELAAALVAELLKGPADPTLKSPFPKGTALLSAEQKGTELRVDLSAAYSTLSGVGLSLADYAITLTLTQLPDVARVRINKNTAFSL